MKFRTLIQQLRDGKLGMMSVMIESVANYLVIGHAHRYHEFVFNETKQNINKRLADGIMYFRFFSSLYQISGCQSGVYYYL